MCKKNWNCVLSSNSRYGSLCGQLCSFASTLLCFFASGKFCFVLKNTSLLLRFYDSMLLSFYASPKKWPYASTILCFYASMRLKKTFPEKSSFASTLLVKISLKNSSLSSACTLLRFPASTLLRFYAFGTFSPKKSTFACKHLRFYASEQFSQQISPFASELLASMLLEQFPPKNHPLLLRFFASMLLEQFSQQKSSFASTLLRF